MDMMMYSPGLGIVIPTINLPTVPPAPQVPKTNFLDTLFKVADSATNVITAIKQPSGSKLPVTTASGGAAPGYQPPVPPPNNTMRNVLIGLGVAGVVGIGGYALYQATKKKK